MRTWGHSGFSVDQSVFLPAGDQAGIERLMQYMTRCPFRPFQEWREQPNFQRFTACGDSLQLTRRHQ